MSSAKAEQAWRVEAFYDDDCGLCQLSAAVVRRLDPGHRVRLTPLSAADLPDGPDTATLHATMHVRDRDGTWYLGGEGWIAATLAVPLLRPLGLVARLPGPRHAVNALYDRIAPRRARISRRLGLTACGLEPRV